MNAGIANALVLDVKRGGHQSIDRCQTNVWMTDQTGHDTVTESAQQTAHEQTLAAANLAGQQAEGGSGFQRIFQNALCRRVLTRSIEDFRIRGQRERIGGKSKVTLIHLAAPW